VEGGKIGTMSISLSNFLHLTGRQTRFKLNKLDKENISGDENINAENCRSWSSLDD